MPMSQFKPTAQVLLLTAALLITQSVAQPSFVWANPSEPHTTAMEARQTSTNVSMAQKMKFYSKLYPQFFSSGYQQVAYQGPAAPATAAPAPRGNPGVVKLLISSFNGETDYHALRQVLHYTPSSASMTASAPPAVQTAVLNTPKVASQKMAAKSMMLIKSQQDLIVLLNRYGLTWQDYESLTDEIAHNPSVFEQFFKELDAEMVQNQLVARAQTDPGFVAHVGHAGHQQILKQMMARLLEKPSKMSMR